MTNQKRLLSLAPLLALVGVATFHPESLGGQEYMGDFMFHQPKVTVTFNLGYGMPSVGSDIFDELESTFTLDRGEFDAPVIGGGLSIYLNDRVDLAFEFSYASASTWSEYVDWVDDADLPIEQETRFTQIPVTASVRYFLMSRGREIGNLSWIPTTWAPYIGAGGGQIFYELEQAGDFVDFVDFSIFYDELISNGWSWVGHVFGGVQWALSPQMILTAEGRYSLADAALDRTTYRGYEPIDLSGFKGTIGFGFRF